MSATATSDLTRTAADLLETPMAAISVINPAGGQRDARVAIAGGKRSFDTLATWALCRPSEVWVVDDSAKDPELQNAPSKSGLADARFYTLLTLSSAGVIGALCVMGRQPRELSLRQGRQAQVPGRQVIWTREARQRDRH